MTHARIFTLLSILTLVDLACIESSTDSSVFGSLRNGSGGRAQNLSSGGGMWINNVFEDPNVGGVDPAFSLESPQGLATTHGLLLQPATRDAVRSMVECALPAEHSITKQVNGEVLVLYGELGLAPEWEDDACDEDCQEWVSACLLARSNISGQTISVWMRAEHPAIGEGKSTLYPTYEASFFGNLFVESQQEYYCQGVNEGALLNQLEARTCAGPFEAPCELAEYTACQTRRRCTFSKSSTGDSPKNCVGGPITTGHAYHTINTYVGPS